MQKLKELGISTKNASMCWINDSEGNATAELHDEFCYEMSFMNPVPAFTLQDMLEIMPEIYSAMVNCEREYSLNKKNGWWLYSPTLYVYEGEWHAVYINSDYSDILTISIEDNPLDAAFEMLCWLVKNKLFIN